LIEQAAAFSGAADEERASERITEEEEELERLTKTRSACQEQGLSKIHPQGLASHDLDVRAARDSSRPSMSNDHDTIAADIGAETRYMGCSDQ
jgi:hypothetical protein